MTYTIVCMASENGWMYRVALWQGRRMYLGSQEYKRYGAAVRAAKATGATADPDRD